MALSTLELRSCSLGYLRSEAEEVILTAKPSPGYQFTSWTGIETGSEPVMKLVMDYPGQSVEITATFVPNDTITE